MFVTRSYDFKYSPPQRIITFFFKSKFSTMFSWKIIDKSICTSAIPFSAKYGKKWDVYDSVGLIETQNAYYSTTEILHIPSIAISKQQPSFEITNHVLSTGCNLFTKLRMKQKATKITKKRSKNIFL